MKIIPKRNNASQRRNRRLTLADRLPSKSNFSYSSSRVEEKLGNTGRHEEETSKPKNLTLARIEIIVVVLILLAVIYKMLYVMPSAVVKPLSDSDIISSSQISKYQSLTDSILNSSILNKNKLTINSSAIGSKIMSIYPQVQSVSVKFGVFSSKPIIYIDQTQGVLIIKNLNNEYFSVNLLGRAIKVSSSLNGLNLPSNLPEITDQSGYQVSVNKQALPSSDIAFILTVEQELVAKSIGISSYTLPASSRELDVGITGEPYVVKFNLENSDARQQAGTYLATITQLKSQNITPSKYIDVRVDGRAYYQ